MAQILLTAMYPEDREEALKPRGTDPEGSYIDYYSKVIFMIHDHYNGEYIISTINDENKIWTSSLSFHQETIKE